MKLNDCVKPERLKFFRTAMGYSQLQVANYLGVTQNHVSSVESGKRHFPFTKLEKLSVLYGCKVSDFVEDTGLIPSPIALRSDEGVGDLEIAAKMRKVFIEMTRMKAVINRYEQEREELQPPCPRSGQ